MSAGTYFGKFFLLKRLAQGGMGEIYIARQQGPGGFSKTVALKKILPHLTDNKEFIQGFLGEAALSAKMTHRNIVQVFDFGLDEETNSYFLTMEYIAGKALNEIIEALQQRRERMPLGLVKDIAMQMCDGMSYAHNLTDDLGQALNLVHRDLNPSNLLVSYNGDVKIIDWGIAKSEMSQVKTEAGMIKGKFVYMSPEQSMAKSLDKRSDVFAAGITLYEMLTGENPFHKPNVVLSLEAIQRHDPPPPSEYDPAFAPFDAIVARALAKDPDRRYPDCGDMAEDLKSVIVPPAPERVGPFVGRLFRADLEQEQKLMQETGAARAQPPRSTPGARAPAPAVPQGDDDEKGGTLVMGGNEVDQERLRREMEAARRKLEVAQAAHRASQTGGTGTLPAMEPAQRTMFIGADELQPPPRRSSNKGLFIGIFAGVTVGLIGVAAFFFLQNQGTAKPAEEQQPVIVNVVKEPTPEPPKQEKKVEAAPEPEKKKVEEAPVKREKRPVVAEVDAAARREAEQRAAEEARRQAEREAAEAAEAARRQAAAEAAEAERARQAQVASASVKGTLLLKPIPAMPGRLDGKALDSGGRLMLRNDSGTVSLGDGSSPLRITVTYRVRGEQILATVNTEPWSILSVGETSKGRVPQTVVIGDALQKLEFRAPGLDPSPRVMVKFSKQQ